MKQITTLNKINGLGVITQYTPAQLSQMSLANLRAIMADAQSEIDYITDQLNNHGEGLSEETKQGMRDNILQYQAIVASIQAWLSLTPQQQATTNGGTFIRTKQQQYVNSYQKAVQYVTQETTDTTGTSFLDTLAANFAGLPLYAWLGIAAAGIYFVVKQ